MADGCLFCAIASGDVPSDRVLERDDVIVFRDIAPAAPTHVLVVPRAHVADARAIRAEHAGLIASMLDAANETARTLGLADGYRLVLNIGEHAGQTVHHLHLHVLGGAPLGPMATPERGE